MLVDGIGADQLEDIAIANLKAANTIAGQRVYAWHDWPTSPDQFPLLLVSTPRDRKVTAGMGYTQFNTTISLVVVARVVAPSHQQAANQLRQLRSQIEDGVMCQPSLTQYVQRFSTVDTQVGVTSEGMSHIGELGMTFDIEVFQFFAYDGGSPLTNITGTIEPGGTLAPTFDISVSTS